MQRSKEHRVPPWCLTCLMAAAMVLVGRLGASAEEEEPKPQPATEETKSEAGAEEQITNSIGLKLKRIPACEFLMGTDESEADLEKDFGKPFKGFSVDDEHPEHTVKIGKPYYLGVYEVTLSEFREFINDADYRTEAELNNKGAWGWSTQQRSDVHRADYSWRYWGVNQSETSPVSNVSWNDAVAFCDWLTKKEGKKYRLPTEAEWECACRAGTSSRFYGGFRPLDIYRLGNLCDQTQKEYRGVGRIANSDGIPTGELTVYPEGRDGFAFTSPAGRFRPNAFGLYDMLGNVSEWCSDWYAADYYKQSPELDPQGPETGTEKVIRGGHFNGLPFDCRSSCRRKMAPGKCLYLVGFRVLREVE